MQLGAPQRLKCYDALIRMSCVEPQQVCANSESDLQSRVDTVPIWGNKMYAVGDPIR